MIQRVRILLCGALWLSLAGSSPCSDLEVPLMHGAIFNVGGEIGWDRNPVAGALETNVEKLNKIKDHGYQMAIPWFKVPGHALATPIFDWADANDMPLMLMLHQGWEPRMVFDRYAEDPELWLENNINRARRWADRIKGHKSVKAVILGNETIPHVGTPSFISRWPVAESKETIKAADLYLGAEDEGGGKSTKEKTDVVKSAANPSEFWTKVIHNELAEKYGDNIESLNRNWKTRFENFADVDIPSADSGGWHDLRVIARKHFAVIMDALIREGFKPTLGQSVLYCSKHSRPDPFTWRECEEITCASWDDVEALFPLWVLKAAADTTRLPVFNAELHLYHDTFSYLGSPAISRYRYLTSALLGEYWTGSFKFDNWKSNPAVLINHSQTTGVLQELEKTQQYYRAIAKAYQEADLNVLLTEENWFFSAELEGHYGVGSSEGFDPTKLDYNDIRDLMRRKMVVNFMDGNPFAEVYARLSMLGKPWRYFLENDLSEFKKGILVVWSPQLKLETARSLADLPVDVRLIFVETVPAFDQYRHPLPDDLIGRLTARGEVVKMALLEKTFKSSSIMRSEYQNLATVRRWKLKRPATKIPFDVPYAALEVKSAETPLGRLVVITNNTAETKSAPLPWSDGNYLATDLNTGETLSPEVARKNHEFTPFAVRLFRLEPKS